MSYFRNRIQNYNYFSKPVTKHGLLMTKIFFLVSTEAFTVRVSNSTSSGLRPFHIENNNKYRRLAHNCKRLLQEKSADLIKETTVRTNFFESREVVVVKAL